MNLKRRHLTASQRAVIALEVLPKLEEEAKERMEGGSPILDEGKRGRADTKASELFVVARGYIAEAKRIKERDPEMIEKVREGKLTIPEAKKEPWRGVLSSEGMVGQTSQKLITDFFGAIPLELLGGSFGWSRVVQKGKPRFRRAILYLIFSFLATPSA